MQRSTSKSSPECSPKAVTGTWRRHLTLWLMVVGGSLLGGACGYNVYEGLAENDGDRYHMAEARIRLNDEDYGGAQRHLAQVKHNSSRKVLLEVSARLGSAGLNFWQLLLDVFDQLKDSNDGGGNGMEKVFSLLSDSVFGNGEDRDSRLTALSESILAMNEAPDADDPKLEALRCFLSGILVLPTANDGQTAMVRATKALDDLAASLEDSAGPCADLTNFELAMSEVAKVQASLALVLQQTAGCSMLNFLQTSGSLNEVEKRLQKFTVAADQGCAALACDTPICRALATGCVQEVIGDTTAVAGDGRVNRCELVYNCRTPGTCF